MSQRPQEEVFTESRPSSRRSMRTSDNGVQGEPGIRLISSLFVEKEPCKRCYKYIYPMELIGPIMGYRYHKQCFR